MRILAALGCVLLLSSAAAYANPFVLEFNSTISSAGTPGISDGDAITLDLTVNNGGSSYLGQTWNLADLEGFTIRAGSFSGSYSTVYPIPTTGNFTTDASGTVTSVQFDGTAVTSVNSDTFTALFTGDAVFGNAMFDDSLGNTDGTADGNWSNASEWHVLEATPEPGTLALIGAGLFGLAVVRRRKA